MDKNHALAVVTAGLVISLASLNAHSAGAEAGKSAGSSKASGSKPIERGRYMVQTGHCNNCHTAAYTRKEGNVPEQDRLLGNPQGFRGPWGTTYASNLRLTVQSFTADQWAKYARAVKPRPPMPWWSLRDTTEQDLRAMHQYIKHLGAAGAPAKAFVPSDKEPDPPYELRRLVQ